MTEMNMVTSENKSSATFVAREGNATLHRVAGISVLHLKGTHREMGYQHGRLLREEVLRGPLPYYQRYLETAVGARRLGSLGVAAIGLLQRWIGKSVAQGMPGYAVESIEGLAEAVGLPFEEVMTACTMPDAMLWAVARMMEWKRIPPAVWHRLMLGLGCTSAIAWGSATRDGRLLHARNLDYQGVGPWPSTATVAFHEPVVGHRYAAVTAAGVLLGGVTAMNEAGLTLTVHQHMFTKETRLGGYPIGTVGDRVMREASTLQEAEAILASQTPIGCWTYLIADGKSKEVLCWEESPRRGVGRRTTSSDSSFGYSNIYLDRELGSTEADLYGSYWRHNVGRYKRTHDLLAAGTGTLDPLKMAQILADFGPTPCRFRDAIAMPLTVASVVFRPEDGVFWVGNGEVPTSHGTFVPYSLGHMGHAPEHGTLDPSRDLDPHSREAFEHYRRAYLAYQDNSDKLCALEELEHACALQPDQPVYHAVRGLIGLNAQKPERARIALDRAIELGHPDQERLASFYLWRGRAKDVLGDRDGATKDYREALGRPMDRAARNAVESNLLKAYSARKARSFHIDMALGDVIQP